VVGILSANGEIRGARLAGIFAASLAEFEK